MLDRIPSEEEMKGSSSQMISFSKEYSPEMGLVSENSCMILTVHRHPI